MPRAYSYRRFSSLKQSKGDSVRRQTEARERYLLTHPELVLDDSLRMTDAGVSGFRGKNRQAGTALAAFIAAIESGQVEPGSVLIIENLDRLSRDQVGRALRLFMDVLEAGVKIVTLSPEREYDERSLNDIADLLEPLVCMQRAWEESQIKSVRGQARWKARRDNAAKGRKAVFARAMIPAWLKPNADKTDFAIDHEAAARVKQIFEMALQGYGAIGICKRLNASGVKPIGRTGRWNYPYIVRILANRAVLGEYQAHTYADGRKRRIGEPVKDYFPRVISDRLFSQVQATMRGRAPQFGRVGCDVSNLFTALLIDARDGRRFIFRGKNIIDHKGTAKQKRRCYRYLINSGAVHGETEGNGLPAPYKIGFPYHVFESMFLLAVKELKIDEFEPDKGNGVAKLAELLDRQAEIAASMAATKRRVANPEKGVKVDVLLDLLVDLEQERNSLQAKIDEQKLKATGHSTRVLKETRRLVEQLEKAKGDERTDLRERIRGRIKALVDRIYLLIWKGKTVKHALAQIHFFNGSVRVLYCTDQWDGRTLLNPPIAPERDLRNYREHPWKLDEVEPRRRGPRRVAV
jgi:DNA invertase Pin-like site-specific DNA recombinase